MKIKILLRSKKKTKKINKKKIKTKKISTKKINLKKMKKTKKMKKLPSLEFNQKKRLLLSQRWFNYKKINLLIIKNKKNRNWKQLRKIQVKAR